MNYFIIVLVSVISYGSGAKLPSSFKICKRSEADLNGCFKEAVQVAFPLLKDGVPELGIARCDPIEVDSMNVAGAPGAVNVEQKYKNLKIHGITRSIVDNAELTVGEKNFKAVVYITIPKIKADADYELDGKILMLPITGSGKCHVELDNVKAVITMIGETFNRKGKTYVKINDRKVKVAPGGAFFQFDNLFNGDKQMGDRMNKMMNDNWKSLFGEVSEGYEDVLADVIQGVANAVFTKVPYDELLPA